jgi:hypothetical protein
MTREQQEVWGKTLAGADEQRRRAVTRLGQEIARTLPVSMVEAARRIRRAAHLVRPG